MYLSSVQGQDLAAQRQPAVVITTPIRLHRQYLVQDGAIAIQHANLPEEHNAVHRRHRQTYRSSFASNCVKFDGLKLNQYDREVDVLAVLLKPIENVLLRLQNRPRYAPTTVI